MKLKLLEFFNASSLPRIILSFIYSIELWALSDVIFDQMLEWMVILFRGSQRDSKCITKNVNNLGSNLATIITSHVSIIDYEKFSVLYVLHI